MDLYHTTDVDGISELNPSETTLRHLIDRLDDADAGESEHPDISLVHDATGWSISIFPSGIVTLENLEEPDEAPLYMSRVTRQKALKLWLDLANGAIDQVKQHPWQRDAS